MQDPNLLQEQITLLQALASDDLEALGDHPSARDLKDAIANNIRKAQAAIGNERAGKGKTQTNIEYMARHYLRAAEIAGRLRELRKTIHTSTSLA